MVRQAPPTMLQIYLVLDTAANERKGKNAGKLLVLATTDIAEASKVASWDRAYMLFGSKGEVPFVRVTTCPCCGKLVSDEEEE